MRAIATRRRTRPASPYLSGIMHYVELDVQQPARWFHGTIRRQLRRGRSTMNINGLHRLLLRSARQQRNARRNVETGEYGFEDIVNPASAAGPPNGVLDIGEDFNGNGRSMSTGRRRRLAARRWRRRSAGRHGAAATPLPGRRPASIRPTCSAGLKCVDAAPKLLPSRAEA